LLVLGDNTVTAIHVLPEAGSVTIGRDAANEIQIDDESISRRHAVLHVGEVVSIEELGSSNGTKLRDARLEPNQPQQLGVNELLTLGSVTVILQQRFTPGQTNRIATQDYFQTRVEEECARAERSGAQFAVIGLRAENETARVLTAALLTTLRQSDVLARFEERVYALLAIDATREQAEQIAARMVGALEEAGATASSTIAHFPSDARGAFALLTRVAGDEDVEREDVIVEEQSMRDLYALARRIAASDLSVLILGETGVGKEKMSRTLHQASHRADGPFVVINCAALNDALLESELFGHERGSFTGANTAKRGLLETADGGTLFLDEIGDMSLAIQAKLLRVIEDGEVRPVGGVRSKTISVRFVAATNVDLEAAVERGSFRGDLYFRLSAATLVIPPLRERPREIVVLARWFAARAGARMGRPNISFRPDALGLLRNYSWPGNIRELRNVVERAVVLCTDDLITDEHLPVAKMTGTYLRSAAFSNVDERARVIDALAQAEGNQSKAASLLGVSRRTLINRLERYNLPRPRKRRDT
jgi:two-component system response regulator AtoC